MIGEIICISIVGGFCCSIVLCFTDNDCWDGISDERIVEPTANNAAPDVNIETVSPINNV